MLITTTTTFGFAMPEDKEKLQEFVLNHDTKEWTRMVSQDFDYVSYTKVTSTTVTNAR